MEHTFQHWAARLLDRVGMTAPAYDELDRWMALLLVILVAVAVDFLCRWILIPVVRRIVARTSYRWDDEIFNPTVLRRGCHLFSGMLLAIALQTLFEGGNTAHTVAVRLTGAGIVVVGLRLVDALLQALYRIAASRPVWQNKPIKGLLQTARGIAFFIAAIFVVSILLHRDPSVFLTGLTASAAVVMLIFRDSILGFVSGIQLSANDMLQVGDWISMPKYGADGSVIEVTLTTVKIRNWDNTVVTLPPYLLVSDSFQNWRAMQQSGGRRVMRSVSIDMTSVRFCTPEMLDRYRSFDLLRDYVESTERRIAAEGFPPGSGAAPVDGVRQTNLGVFRAYLLAYIRARVPYNKEMMVMVRQLQPTETGLPLQVYFFTDTVVWTEYESIQADLFDHLLAVVPYFDLRLFQNPSGSDVAALCRALSKQQHEHDLNDDHAQKHADGVDRGV